MKKQFYKLYEVTHALLLTLLLSIVGVRAFCSASFVTNVSSTLTGESGIVAFTCPEVGTLYNAWVDAGRPGKRKIRPAEQDHQPDHHAGLLTNGTDQRRGEGSEVPHFLHHG